MDIFTEISLIILLVTVVSFIMKLLKQPFIVGYILSGIIAGPYFLNLLHSEENIEFFSKIGITILLFIVGIHLSPKVIKETGKASLVTGLGQVLFTSVVGYGICRLLGFDNTTSIYIATALTFSSTIIILKLLTDKGDMDKLYGKISVGFLLVQDLVATFALIIVSTLARTNGGSLFSVLGFLTLKGILLGVLIAIVSIKILPRLSKSIASAQELLFIFSIAWGMILASIFYKLGFSIEIGALVAGVALSTTPFAYEIASRLKPLRDFFILLFFILLGSQMVLDTIPQILVPSIIMFLLVFVGNPAIVILLMNLLGYKRKTGFMAGLTVAQIGEFSLIFASMGVAVGHVSEEILSLVTLVALLTIASSTYLILYSEKIYAWTERAIKLLEVRKVQFEKQVSSQENHEVILFGYDRVGSDFVKAIQKLGKSFVVVDYNPEAIERLKKEDLPFAYGDADDVEFLEDLNISQARLIISTIPDVDTNKLLVEKLHHANPKAVSIVLSHNAKETLELYDKGASYVITPIYLGAQYASHMITKHGLDAKSFEEEKQRHLQHLSKRVDIL